MFLANKKLNLRPESITMQNRFIKNIIFLLFLNLLVKPFWILGVEVDVQNLVGDNVYGQYLSIFNFTYLFYILLDLGINNFNNRNIAQNANLLDRYFAGIAQVKLFLGILYSAVVFVCAYVSGFRSHEQLVLLAWCAANQILLSFILYLRSNVSGLLMFKTDSLLSVLDRLIAIVVCAFMLWSGVVDRGGFRILWFVRAQTFAYTVTFIVALVIVLRQTGKLDFKIDVPFFVSILKDSFPFALLALLMSFYSRLEPILLERMLGDSGFQAGLYGRAYRLFDAANNLAALFGVILLPMFASVIKKGDDLKGLLSLSANIMIAIAGIGAVMCICYSTDIIEAFYGQQENESYEAFAYRVQTSSAVLSVLMGSFFAVSMTYIYGTLLTANGSLKQLNIMAATGVVVNVLLNVLLIPRFKAVGAAFSSLSVQMLMAVIQFVLVHKILKLKIYSAEVGHLVAFSVLVVASTLLLKLLPMQWYFSFAITLAVNVALIFATRLLDIKKMGSVLLPMLKSKFEK